MHLPQKVAINARLNCSQNRNLYRPPMGALGLATTHTHTHTHLHACMCLLPVHPAVRHVGNSYLHYTVTVNQIPRSQATLSPGNASAVHRGETSAGVRGEGKQKGSRKGRSLAPTGAEHLSPLRPRGARRGFALALGLWEGFGEVTWKAPCVRSLATRDAHGAACASARL